MKESKKKRAKRALEVAKILAEWYPDDDRSGLEFSEPFELLVATILSAQSTDVLVNKVAPGLFAVYPDPASIASAPPEKIEHLIYSTGFYRAKTRSIIGAAQAILEKHNGQVPATMEELVQLPGVGRKTANVILSQIFRQPGIIVDTHLRRLAQRLGFTTQQDPEKIEYEINELLPKKEWSAFSHRLTWLGRRVCIARKPRCTECRLQPLCPTGKK